MNQKERHKLMQLARSGRSQESEHARVLFRLDVDLQNAKEVAWTLEKLCKTIQRESGNWRSSEARRAFFAPYVRVLASGDIAVWMFEQCMMDRLRTGLCKRPRSVPAVYTGPLAEYWRATLGM